MSTDDPKSLSDVRELKRLEQSAASALAAAIAAVETLAEARADIPVLLNQRRQAGVSEFEVSRFGESLHTSDATLARHLLTQLSGTKLGTLLLDYGPQFISRFRPFKPAA